MILLNTPMPSGEALKIIRSIYESNRMVDIVIEYTYQSMDGPKHVQVKLNSPIGPEFDTFLSPVTILSITPVITQYSVGDKVLILDTGEIAEVTMVRGGHRDKPIELNYDTDQFYHWSELAKLPNDL